MTKTSASRSLRVVLTTALLLLLVPSWLPAMTDVTDRVQLIKSSWRKNAREKSKSLDVALENTSQAAVWAPIRVVIDGLSDSRVVVANADGVTQDGRPYFGYSPQTGLLLPGEITESREWVFQYPHPKVKLGHRLSFSASVWGCTDADFDGYYLEPDCGTIPDCNDDDPLINPAVEEVCDEVDNNCSGEVDEGVTLAFYRDSDGDGYGDPEEAIQACSAPAGYVQNLADCEDGDPHINPAAEEVCDEVDNNCDSEVDEGVTLPFYRDSDGDGYGDPDDTVEGCSAPVGYVENSKDCNDNDSNWWDRDDEDGCLLAGYTDCDYAERFSKQCNPAVTGVPARMTELGEDSGTDVHKDKFSWRDFHRPGKALSSSHAKHLQSIQVLERGARPYLLVTMSDETPTDAANVSLVWTGEFGSEDTPDDAVERQALLRPGLDPWNHAGGAQLIGEWLFVALEDFDGADCSEFSPAITGVWKIEGFELEWRYPIFLFEAGKVDCEESEAGEVDEYHHTSVGVTKLKDESYLVAACVVKGCDTILFYRSHGSSLGSASFQFLGKWEGMDSLQQSSCPPQNMNLVVDSTGDVYVVMFGKIKPPGTCGVGDADDYLFVYKLGLVLGDDGKHHFDLAYETSVDIGTGDACDCVPFLPCPDCASWCSVPIHVTGTNFEAGSGLWIRPGGKDDIAVVATEHYDSCGDGKSRWGVTGNWDDE